MGCGRGYFLRSLEAGGHEAIGLELNDYAIANKLTKFEVRKQMLNELVEREPASFDAVCSFQVLEHVTDPGAFIRNCLRVVRPGGSIILSTPNYSFPLHRDGGDPFDMPPHHLNYFTEDTYRRIALAVDAEFISTKAELDRSPRRAVWVHDGQSRFERSSRRALNALLAATAGEGVALGHTLLAIIRRR